MKRYALKLITDNEVINTVKAVDTEQAIEMFTEIKRMSKKDLLKIYFVDIFIR